MMRAARWRSPQRAIAAPALPASGPACVGRRPVLMAALAGLLGLGGCEAEPQIRIGLLVGPPDRNGQAGRNGAILAVEQRNAGGGMRGRELQLVVQDVGAGQDAAQAAGKALLAAGVDAIVGPFTSAVAMAVLPQVNAARVLMVSPTATASELTGVDDYLVCLSPTAREAGSEFAAVLYQRGQRRVALARADEETGPAYTRSWSEAFDTAFRALGGTIVMASAAPPGLGRPLGDMVRALLAHRPDGLVFVGGTAEVARMVQQARKQAPDVPIAVAEPASNLSLIELGGRAVEGAITARQYSLNDNAAPYAGFQAAYRERFALLPVYHAIAAYDAVTVLADAMAAQRRGESLKEAVLRNSPYQGVVQSIVFDRFGDVARKLSFVVVRAGRFEPLR
ncbi:MAG TPA: ABC transporter substrate-binding protein [Pseudorhodoferax sp.]|nr:ABC transporter substrate-binding protein [Pseudorhodoferax sp.]